MVDSFHKKLALQAGGLFALGLRVGRLIIRRQLQNQTVGLLLGRQLAVTDAGKTVGVIEKHGHVTNLNVPLERIQILRVIPSILVKLTANQGFSQQELHLSSVHPDLQFVDHFLGDQVALRYVRAINQKIHGIPTAATAQRHDQSGNRSENVYRPKSHIDKSNKIALKKSKICTVAHITPYDSDYYAQNVS